MSSISKDGIFLLSDPKLPSLATLIAGGPIKGSWWGHPKGGLIFNISMDLAQDSKILPVKLINGKVTFIHRKLWGALQSVATCNEGWQLQGLKRQEATLLRIVQLQNEIRSDDRRLKGGPSAVAKLAKALESKLLIYSEESHSSTGKHVRVMKSWKQVFRERRFASPPIPMKKAKSTFERIASQWEFSYGTPVKLPWSMRSRSSGPS